ncbi:MAG: DUF892 family protein [Gallicola sp.]|nr:DUF892 family protein [Gallicola sp.]
MKRLEEVFRLVGEEPAGEKCEGIMGIIKEGITMIEETDEDSMVRDCAIIIAGQKAEHYEIATYGSLAELARTLGLDEVADILEQTLDEEKSADVTLTELAVESINEDAKEERGFADENPEQKNQNRGEQINDFQQANEHGDYRKGDSDSEYPAQSSKKNTGKESKKQEGEEDKFLDSDDDIADYRGKNRGGIDRDTVGGADYR